MWWSRSPADNKIARDRVHEGEATSVVDREPVDSCDEDSTIIPTEGRRGMAWHGGCRVRVSFSSVLKVTSRSVQG